MLVRMTFPLVAMLVFMTGFFGVNAYVVDFCRGHFAVLLGFVSVGVRLSTPVMLCCAMFGCFRAMLIDGVWFSSLERLPTRELLPAETDCLP
jgi:hypothetical protein